MNISSTEILIVLIVALIVLGPQRLPDAMKTAGKAYREFRKVSGTVQREINEVVNETTGMFTSTADVISGKPPTTQNGATKRPSNAAYRPADELPADEVLADEVPAGELPADEVPTGEPPAGELPAGALPEEEPPAEQSGAAMPAVEAEAGEAPAIETTGAGSQADVRQSSGDVPDEHST